MKEIISRIIDESKFEEYKKDYGKSIVCGYARIDGWAIGLVANQRKIIGKTALGQLPASQYWQGGSNVNKFGRQLTAFDVTLDMLLKDNRAQILTNSQVVTVNGHEAMIEMVDEIPYLASNGGEGNTNFQVAKESVGIKLKILPYVNADGFITTNFHLSCFSLISQASFSATLLE